MDLVYLLNVEIALKQKKYMSLNIRKHKYDEMYSKC